MSGQEKRTPGEKNPVASSAEIEHITNAALASNGKGTSDGVSRPFLGALAAFRTRRAKKRAIAAWEAERRDGTS